MPHDKRVSLKHSVVKWIDTRLPIFTYLNKEYGQQPMPRNLNYLWSTGALASAMLVILITTGFFLALNYTPTADHAFASVQHIMRGIKGGWLLRYVHASGASMLFIVVYVHLFRSIFYGSYKAPRELLWIFGVFIFLVMMGAAFTGYVLPWSQTSYWGATVIINIVSTLPFLDWLSVGDPMMLGRIFVMHILLPILLIGFVFLHVVTLHVSGSNNPLGIEPKSAKDTITFHPYYTIKDLFALSVCLIFLAAIVFYAPRALMHPDNFIPADPMSTPAQIVPEWYFMPFFAMLRAFTGDVHLPFTHMILLSSTSGGIMLMFGSVAVLFFLPWLDRSKVRSAWFRPLFRMFFWVLVVDCLTLGFVGSQPVEQPFITIGQAATFYYFFHFLVILPMLAKHEKTLPLPESIHQSMSDKKRLRALLPLVLLIGLATSVQAADAPAPAAPIVIEQQVVQSSTEDSEPQAAIREQIGAKTILFLAAFAVVIYLLKHDIWKRLR